MSVAQKRSEEERRERRPEGRAGPAALDGLRGSRVELQHATLDVTTRPRLKKEGLRFDSFCPILGVIVAVENWRPKKRVIFLLFSCLRYD
jgi:hypothetical protein